MRRLRRLLSKRVDARGHPRDDAGFGMVDTIIAMVVLIAVLVPTSYLFTNVLANAAQARQRLTALSIAEQWIETLNNQGPPSDANGQPEVGVALSSISGLTNPETLSGIKYSASATFKWTDATGGTPDFCSTDTSPVLGLQVTVSWASNQSITDQAILNFPATGNLTDGYLAVQVEGDPAGGPPVDVSSTPWSSRVTTVPVQVSGSNLTSPYSLNPDSNGCTFLALSPGTYSVQVGPGPTSAYVANYNEAASETQALANQSAITVTDAEITEVVFQYDEGAYVGLAYPSTTAVADGMSCPNVGPLICLSTGQAPTSASAPNTSPQAVGIAETASGWSVASFPSSMTRIEGVGCTTGACIAVGYGSSGGAAAVTTNGTTWTASALPSGSGVSELDSIVCPKSATTPACIAIGSGTSSNGVLLTATVSGSTVTWTKDSIPSTTSLNQISCPGSTTQPVCYVLGSTSSGATIFSNSGSSSPGTTWKSWTLQSGVTVSGLTQMACNSQSFCVAIGTAQTSCGWRCTTNTPEIFQLSSGTWDEYTNSSGTTPTAFTAIACTTSGTACWATGTTSSSSIGLYLSSGTTWKADSGIPSGTKSLSGLTCPGSTSGCFSLYQTSSTVGVISIGSGTSWSTASLPSNGAVSLEDLVCPTSSACYAVGTSSSSAIVDVLASGSWSSATFSGTTGGSPVYVTGLVCTDATTCVASADTETAGQILTYASSTTSFSGSSTPTGLSGLYLINPPIMVSNPNLEPNSVIEMAAPTTGNGPQTEVGPLFPFQAGYSIAPGYCSSELTTASSSAATTPGASPTTSPAAPTVIMPMGLLPIEAVNSSRQPISGATITIADATCTSSTELTPLSSGNFPALSNPPANPSNPTSYTLPTSGADGLSRIAVIYGTYLVTVKLGNTSASTTVTVNPTSIVVGSTTYYMPTTVPIAD
jgi:Tfp pilus assembly protein PilV